MTKLSKYKLNNLSFNMRIVYIIAIAITIFLGLASRKFSHSIVYFVAENAGDALWAMMVYFGCRFIFVRKRQLFSMLISILFSFSIEFSQLYQAAWINQIRASSLGALILGHGFLTVDLVRYAVGILIAVILDRVIIIVKIRTGFQGV